MSSGPQADRDWLRRLVLLTLTVASASPLLMVFAGPNGAEEPARANSTSIVAAPDVTEPMARHFLVEVTGRAFRWQFRVLEPAGNANEAGYSLASHQLTVPADSIIDWKLTSDDYIYTFSIPSLGINEVAAPDVLRQWRSGPLTQGTYELPVDPICGFQFYHDDLMGRLIVKAGPDEQPLVTHQLQP